MSSAVDATAGDIVRILLPADWTPANISFQVAQTSNDADFHDLYIANGGEVLIPCVPGVVFGIGREAQEATRDCFVRVRSGTSGAPVVQEAARAFTLFVNKAPQVQEGGAREPSPAQRR
jgi:hypothetical protein